MENQYIQVGIPATDKLAELIKAIKGPNRSMAQLAKACELSPSTLSRLVNGKLGKPASPELLTKIHENRDPDCTVNLAELMAANGLAPRLMQRDFEAEMERRRAVAQARRKRFDVMREGVKNGLLDRGIQIGLNVPHHIRIEFEGTEKVSLEDALVVGLERYGIPDMKLRVSHNDTDFFWGFHFITMRMEEENTDTRSPTGYALDYAWRIIERRFAYFMKNAFQWNVDEYIRSKLPVPADVHYDIECLEKTSFVFVDAQVYDIFCTIVQSFDLKSNTSAILLDGEKGTFIEERFLTKNGCNDTTDLFKLDLVVKEQDSSQSEGDDGARLARERYRQLSLFDDL